MSNQMVYVVDDDPGVRKAMVWMLQHNGLEATPMASGAEFLKHAVDDCPSCVVLDMHMPGMGGLELLREMTAHPRLLIPVIVLTGAGTIATAVQCMKLGAHDFLEKPVDHAMLVDRIREALAFDEDNRTRADKHSAVKQRIGQLTEREHEVLSLLCEGKSTKQIAATLNISAKTVSIHRWHLMKKMEVGSATEAVQLAFQARAA